MAKKRGLGRGLEALLGDVSKTQKTSNNEVETHLEGELKNLSLEKIQQGKYQPRKDFSEQAIEELADSIRAQGIIQPIVVRTIADNKYEIIAGERRWRAAKLAGLEAIPALIRELPDEAAIAMALIENLQREDLNAIEEASALQRLIDEFEMTHQQVANAVGKSRTAVSNALRLLGLETEVRKMVESGQLEMGHGRALLAFTGAQQINTAHTIAEKNLSVRDAEHLIRRLQNLQKAPPQQTKKEEDPFTHDIQSSLTSKLGAKVLLQQNASGRGKLVIKYKNQQHLQEILDKL